MRGTRSGARMGNPGAVRVRLPDKCVRCAATVVRNLASCAPQQRQVYETTPVGMVLAASSGEALILGGPYPENRGPENNGVGEQMNNQPETNPAPPDIPIPWPEKIDPRPPDFPVPKPGDLPDFPVPEPEPPPLPDLPSPTF